MHQFLRERELNLHRITLEKSYYLRWNLMRIFGKAVLIIIIAALLLPILAFASGEVESRSGEKAAEYLFNKGIGRSWVGGEPFRSTYWTEPTQTFAVRPYTSNHIIGYLNAGNSFSILSDTGKSLQLITGPGSYPVYAYYNGNKMTGLFIDLSSSASRLQMNSYL
jgi:hypothetical protein